MSAPSELERRLATALEQATSAAWLLARCWKEGECLCLGVMVAGGAPSDAPSLTLEVWSALADRRAYRVLGAHAFGYRGQRVPGDRLDLLDRSVAALAAILAEHDFDPTRDALASPASDQADFPTPFHAAHLERETTLSPDLITAYRQDGHVLVRRALDRGVVLAARPCLLAALEREWPREQLPAGQRKDAYSQAFTQITDIGRGDSLVKTFSFARRIARMAADLMGVERVRLFCEDWLIKEADARITPWHQDEAVFPFEAEETITCWIPIQDVGPSDGLLRFARGSHRLGLANVEDISDVSESEFERVIEQQALGIDRMPPVFAGDVSFHHGREIHGAFANTGASLRVALALHCFADGARFKRPTTPKMAHLLATAAPGAAPGEPAASDRWPLLYDARTRPRAAQRRGTGPNFRLRGTLLPGGVAPTELWISEGRLRFEPVEGAVDLLPEGGFISTGLVDCHAHISYPHDPADPVGTAAWMNARRAEYAETGVLVLRDMGAVGDEISGLLDAPGLPRVHASGIMILRFDEFPFTQTEPAGLVAACVERIERGARWVKVFADWSSDYRGRTNSGFTGGDDVTYPRDLLAEAVAAVRALGGRVAAHCFTRAGAEVAIGAGVDSLEHGWGLDETLIREMAAKRIAWAPLVGIAAHMWRVARRDGETDRVLWIERTMSALSTLLPFAEEQGVELLAGTDLFPQVTVCDEILELMALGVSAPAALAAGTWGARAFLGEPGPEEGAPADIVVYAADPRRAPEALRDPRLILAAGKRVMVAPSVRPRFSAWAERERESGESS